MNERQLANRVLELDPLDPSTDPGTNSQSSSLFEVSSAVQDTTGSLLISASILTTLLSMDPSVTRRSSISLGMMRVSVGFFFLLRGQTRPIELRHFSTSHHNGILTLLECISDTVDGKF